MKPNKVIFLGFSMLKATLFVSADQPVHAQAKSDDVTTTKTIKIGKVTIPRGTTLTVMTQPTKKNKEMITVALDDTNYAIRHQTTKTTLTFSAVNTVKDARFKAIYAYHYLVKGKANLTNSAYKKAPRLVLTVNGYAEYYTSSNLNTKPISSTKLTAMRHANNTTYYYAKTNMLKLPDKHIKSKTGKYNYRLAIRANKTSGSYSVGTVRNYFYTPTGNA